MDRAAAGGTELNTTWCPVPACPLTRCAAGPRASYSDALPARLSQLPADPGQRTRTEVNSYSKDGAMIRVPITDPVYAPNWMGGWWRTWCGPTSCTGPDGDMVRSAWHAAQGRRRLDAAWHPSGSDVMDDAARDRLASNIIGHVSDGGETSPIAGKVFEYWSKRRRRSGQERSKRASGQPGIIDAAVSKSSTPAESTASGRRSRRPRRVHRRTIDLG